MEVKARQNGQQRLEEATLDFWKYCIRYIVWYVHNEHKSFCEIYADGYSISCGSIFMRITTKIIPVGGASLTQNLYGFNMQVSQ